MSTSRKSRWAHPLLRAAAPALTVGAALIAGLMAGAPAQAATAPDCGQVYAGPQTKHAKLGYFDLDAEPGSSQGAHLVVANPSGRTCTVKLTAARGETAVNSGNTYVPVRAGRPCTGTACWVQDLPATVSVEPRSRQVVPFHVRVPEGTDAGQFLAGVVAQPTDLPDSPSGSGQVQVRVATRVAVGVAVTVGGALDPKVTISGVRVDTSNAPSRTVQITERNSGNTWEHPRGSMTVTTGEKSVRLPVVSSTLLAGDSAVLSLGADRVAAGTYPARVVLDYGADRKAVWEGDLTFAAPPVEERSGGVAVLTAESVPPWVAVLAGVTVLLLLVVVLLLVLLRRRSRDRHRRPGTVAGLS